MSAILVAEARLRSQLDPNAARVRPTGFTLLELMISVTILMFIVAGVFESMTRQHRTSMVTENIVEVQNNGRAIASLIERDIRMAGFMAPDAAAVCGLDNKTDSDELFISETEQIVPDALRAGDVGARFSGVAWSNPAVNGSDPHKSAANTSAVTASTMDLDGDGNYFYDNDGDGTPESDFRVDGGVIVADLANPRRGSICGLVTAVSANQITFRPYAGSLAALDASKDAQEEIVFLPASRYAVSRTASGVDQLQRNGDLIADGVEDFQVSYFYDVDDDGTLDTANVDVDGDGAANANATEEPGNPSGAAGWSYDPGQWDNSRLREVRFSIVVRTRDTDATFAQGAFIAEKNRTAPAGAPDGFRRRLVTGSVRPRNVNTPGSV